MAEKPFINVRAWLADGLLRRLFRDAGVVLSGNVGASLLGLVSMGVTARALGPELLGILVLLKAYVALIEKLTTFQSWQAVIAHGAQLFEQNRRDDFKALIKFSTLLDASAAVAGALIGMAAAYTYGHWRGWDASQIHLATWYSATLLFSLSGTPKAILRLFGRFHRLAIQEVVGAAIKLAGVITASVMHGGLWAFVVVWMLTEVLGNLLILAMGWHELRRQGLRGALAVPVRGITQRCPGLWGFVWTTNLGGTVKGLSQEADTLVVGGLLGVVEAGLYKLAKQCTQVAIHATDPLFRVLYPELARLWAKQDKASIQRLVRRLGLLGGFLVACALAVVMVFGRQLLSLAFGAAFAPAHAVLVWQMAGALVFAATFPLASAMPATGQYRAAFRISLTGLLFYLPTQAVLAQTAGLVGAGAASLLHHLFRSLLLIRQMRWVLDGTPLAARVGGAGRPPEPAAHGGKRIGMLTYHHVSNEGALLQAYALQQRLQALFPSDRVEFIDYRPLRAELRDAKSAFLSFRDPRRLWHSIPSYFRLKRFAGRALTLSRARQMSDRYEDALQMINGAYDAVVVGSDEVWKVRDGGLDRRFPNIYWLGPGLACKKFAFAASANKTAYRRLPDAQREWMYQTLSRFDLIGARDQHTLDFLAWLGVAGNGKVSRVPDPTFMLDVPVDGVREALARQGVDWRKPVAGLVLSDEALSRTVARHLRSRGFQVVALSSYNRHADVNLMGRLDPLEWAGAYQLMACCVTERFHPTVFCLKSGTPVLVVDHFKSYEDQLSKTQSLLRDVGLDDLSYCNTRRPSFRAEQLAGAIDRVIERFERERVVAAARRQRQLCEQFLESVRGRINQDGPDT